MTKLNEVEKDALDALFVELSIKQQSLFEKLIIFARKFFSKQ